MTKPQDMDNFEVAAIKEGATLDVVLRRRGPRIMDGLAPALRQAVDRYHATAEAVMAGGANNPSDMLTGGCQGGPGSKEGRQAAYVDQVSFLRRMREAVAAARVETPDGEVHLGVFQVGRRKPVEVKALDLWDRVILGEVSMEAYLRKSGLAVSRSRVADLRAGFEAAAERVADAIGAGRDFWAERG